MNSFPERILDSQKMRTFMEWLALCYVVGGLLLIGAAAIASLGLLIWWML